MGPLTPDENTFITAMPTNEASIGNISLQRALTWSDEGYESVRENLLRKGLIRQRRGRGGALARNTSPGPEQTQEPPATTEADEGTLLRLVPPDGSTVSNIFVRRALGWDEERYLMTRDRLVERKTLSLGVGRGGTVYRTKPQSNGNVVSQVETAGAVEAPPSVAKQYPNERSLYQPLRTSIEALWQSNRVPFLLVEDTANQGNLATGGSWTRPDITVIVGQTYQYVPGKFLEVITYEVKQETGWDIAAVFETAAHSRFATRSYLVIHSPKGRSGIAAALLERVQAECARFGIGLIVVTNPGSYETFEFLVDPERHGADPAEMDRFITQQVPDASKAKIAQWLR